MEETSKRGRKPKETETTDETQVAEVTIKAPEQPKKHTNLREYAICTVEIAMASRPHTHPDKKGQEGYPASARIMAVGRTCKREPAGIDRLNRQIDWKNGGIPNHHVYYIPVEHAVFGKIIKTDAVHLPVIHMGKRIGYTTELKFLFDNQ